MQLIQNLLSSGFNAVLVVVGLGLIIFLHELGHFLMAKKNGVRVEVFSLGFGSPIWSMRRGETEYRIAWLPLGGYVKMAGEALTDARSGEPFELTSKTPWQRFQIFVAGATMNLIIAFPIGIAAYAWGMRETGNVIGEPGMAEARDGIQAGDVVLSVGDRKIESLDKFKIEMIRRQQGTVVPVRVLRGKEEKVFPVTVGRSEQHMTQGTTTMLGPVKPGSPLAAAGISGGDEITRIQGESVVTGSQVGKAILASGGRELLLELRRPKADFKDETFEARVRVPVRTSYSLPFDEHLVEPRIETVLPGGASAGLLEPDDVVTRIGDRDILSWKDLKEAVEPRAGQTVSVTVKRGIDTKTVEVTLGKGATGKLGVSLAQGKSKGVFHRVLEGSVLAKAGLRTGDRLLAIDGHACREFGGVPEKGVPVEEWKVPPLQGYRGSKPRTLALKVVGTDGVEREVKLTPEKAEEGDFAALGLETTPEGGLVTRASKPFRRRALGEAVRAGLYEPVDITIMTFEMLRKLVTGGESAKGLSGPLGILHATYTVADLSFGNFVWMLCLITVNLGVFNLLPIPVLDGGHNLLLLIEVVRKWFGKPPPSEKFVAAFQYSGLFFILGLFLFVTFNDVTRFFRG